MKNLPQHIENQFFKFLNKEIRIEDFEQWVYATEELETVLSADNYLDLIAFNFNKINAYDSLFDSLIELIDFPKFEKYRIIYQLNIIIEQDGLWENAVEILHGDCIESYYFLKPFFDLHFLIEDNKGSDVELSDNVFVRAKEAAIKMKNWLNSETIIIKGREGHRKGTNYIDNRKENEK